ncbi:MAG: hypothetical protein ACJ74D_04835 [Gaiellaceae bacterium]
MTISLAALVLAGCGDDAADSSGSGDVVTSLPSCAPSAMPAALPERFPMDFPLPRGSVVREARDDGKTMNLEALVPGAIRDVTDRLLDELPGAGYELGEGDSEEHEAESHFSGNGFDGFFKLNTIGGCDGANTLAVVLTSS